VLIVLPVAHTVVTAVAPTVVHPVAQPTTPEVDPLAPVAPLALRGLPEQRPGRRHSLTADPPGVLVQLPVGRRAGGVRFGRAAEG
jgi:hypothetical protein